MKEIKCPYCGNLLEEKTDDYHLEKKDFYVCEACHSMLHTSREVDGHIELEME